MSLWLFGHLFIFQTEIMLEEYYFSVEWKIIPIDSFPIVLNKFYDKLLIYFKRILNLYQYFIIAYYYYVKTILFCCTNKKTIYILSTENEIYKFYYKTSI